MISDKIEIAATRGQVSNDFNSSNWILQHTAAVFYAKPNMFCPLRVLKGFRFIGDLWTCSSTKNIKCKFHGLFSCLQCGSWEFMNAVICSKCVSPFKMFVTHRQSRHHPPNNCLVFIEKSFSYLRRDAWNSLKICIGMWHGGRQGLTKMNTVSQENGSICSPQFIEIFSKLSGASPSLLSFIHSRMFWIIFHLE